MVRAHADPIDVGRVSALVVDAMTERLIALAIDDLGDPRARGHGSRSAAPRHEQALRTTRSRPRCDPVLGEPDPDPWFADLAERVTAGLGQASSLQGDAMRRIPPSGDRRRVRRGVRHVDGQRRPARRVLSSIGYDFRQVAGPLGARPRSTT
jgi:hypothetical protein